MKIIFVLLLIFSIQNTFGQEKPKPVCSDCNSLAQPISIPKPEYPKEAQNSKINGTVKIQVSIDENGNVTEAKMLEGNKVFEENAIKAAMFAKFKPAKNYFNGKSVKTFGVLVYNFVLDDVSEQNKSKIIEGGICNGRAIYLPKPELPQSVINANGKGIFGTANVQILIDEKGNVEKAQAVTGHPLIRPYAEKAALQAKFRILSDLPPLKMNCILAYNFAAYNPRKSEENNEAIISLGVLNEKALILPMPKSPSVQPRIGGAITVEAKIDLQKGEVVSAKAISGHPLLRMAAEKAALQAEFPPILTEFSDVLGQGILIYRVEDFNGKTVENKNPKRLVLIIERGIVNDRARTLPKPNFPNGGKNAFGFVKVSILIGLDGKVVLAKAVSGHPLLRPFAEIAARETKFAPAIITTEPLYVKAFLLYKFNSDRTVETNLTDENLILGSPMNLPKPPFPSFSGKVGSKKPQVLVQIEIDENGNVISAKAIAGHPVLRAVCERAARSSKFSQTKFKGVTVKAKAILLYEFNLDNDTKKVEVKYIEPIKR